MLVDQVVFSLEEALVQAAEWLGVTVEEHRAAAPDEVEQENALLHTISGIASS
jgi:hypothetical protein